MSLDFFEEKASRTERFWRTQSRDDQEVYSFILDSVGCMYGVAYILNQRKLRCKWGTLDEPVMLDLGTPLSLEKEYHKKENIDELLEDGEYEYHQIGEGLVFFIVEQLLGARPDQPSELSELEMTIYKEDIVDHFDVMSGISTG